MSDESTAKQRARVGLAAGLAAVIGIAVLVVVSAVPSNHLPSGPPAVSMVVVAPASSLAAGSVSTTKRPMASPPAEMPSRTAVGEARDEKSPPRPGMTEVCGLGWVPAEVNIEPDLARTLQALAVNQRIASRLQAESSESSKAVGWFLQRALDHESHAMDQVTPIRQRCGDDQSCRDEALAEITGTAAPAFWRSTNEIARLATGSRNPFVYAVAVQACSSTSVPAPGCQLISARQWARLDPGNAVPWLQVAAEASARNDAAAVDEAMHRVATARSNRLYGYQVAALAFERVPEDLGEVEKLEAFVWLAGLSAAWALPNYPTVTNYCGSAEVANSNRLQTCDAVARRWVNDPTTMMERRIGVRVGERVKWPAEQVSALKDENDVLLHLFHESAPDSQPSSCRALARGRDVWLTVARVGEVEVSRQLAAATGKSMSVLVAESRARKEAAGVAAKAEPERNAASSPAAANANPRNKTGS